MNTNGNSNNGADQITMMVGSPTGMSGQSDDDDDQCPSSPGSAYESNADLMAAAMGDEVTAQLAAAGKFLIYLNYFWLICSFFQVL